MPADPSCPDIREIDLAALPRKRAFHYWLSSTEGTVAEFAGQRESLDEYLKPPGDPALAPIYATLAATSEIAAGPSSEHITPPEQRPDRKVIILLLKTLLGISAIAFSVALVVFVIAVVQDQIKFHAYYLKLFGIGIAVCLFFVTLIARARKKSADHLLEWDDRPPIVYLRSFEDDSIKTTLALRGRGLLRISEKVAEVSFEDAVADIFFKRGPFVALGSKNELLPKFGAARTYVDDSVWQQKVRRWLDGSQAVLVMIGSTAGLKWEMDHIQAMNLAHKAIFMFPPAATLDSGFRDPYKPEQSAASAKAQWCQQRRERQRQRWQDFLAALGSCPLSELLRHVDPDDAILIWLQPQLTIVRADGQYFQDYELAFRLALASIEGADRLPALDPGAGSGNSPGAAADRSMHA